MSVDPKQAEENAISLAKMFFGVFAIAYLFWYTDGGPERWNRKMEKVTIETIKQNIIKGTVAVPKE